jgi:hypothetical protein|tara:strand:+ start:86 stop:355 length:270 start_codon:yes stop_codon:yes gene_type:complete
MTAGWEGIQVLDLEEKRKTKPKDNQVELDKAFARTFESEEGRKVLTYLMHKTLEQPTWIPGFDNSYGYAREGQNSIIREINQRIERAKS